jgi:hypothetical protein
MSWWKVGLFDNLGELVTLGSTSFVAHNFNYKIEILLAGRWGHCCEMSTLKIEVWKPGETRLTSRSSLARQDLGKSTCTREISRGWKERG